MAVKHIKLMNDNKSSWGAKNLKITKMKVTPLHDRLVIEPAKQDEVKSKEEAPANESKDEEKGE